MFCTAPDRGWSTCDPPPEFHWESYPTGGTSGSYQVCGCDGQTHVSNIDSGGVPNVPWKWFGSCEAPCAGVYWCPGRAECTACGSDIEPGWRARGGTDGNFCVIQVAPQCTDCRNAIPELAGCSGGLCPCADAAGLPMPWECCECGATVVSATGTCVHGSYGFEMPAACCG